MIHKSDDYEALFGDDDWTSILLPNGLKFLTSALYSKKESAGVVVRSSTVGFWKDHNHDLDLAGPRRHFNSITTGRRRFARCHLSPLQFLSCFSFAYRPTAGSCSCPLSILAVRAPETTSLCAPRLLPTSSACCSATSSSVRRAVLSLLPLSHAPCVAIGSIMSARWVMEKGVYYGDFCRTQGMSKSNQPGRVCQLTGYSLR